MSPVVDRPASRCWFAQPSVLAAIGLLLLLAILVPGRSQAQNNGQRGTTVNPSSGPVVIPAFADQPPPVRDQPGERVDRARSRQQESRQQQDLRQQDARQQDNATAATPIGGPAAANQMLRPKPDGDPNMASGLRDAEALEALYGTRGFRAAAARRRNPDGFFGAPNSGVLPTGCGRKIDARRATDAVDKCMSALAFVVSPPPATRAVLPRNLAAIPRRDVPPVVPVLADKPKTPPMMEEDPYETKGFTAGNFLLKPALELTTGFDSNPQRVPGGAGSPVIVIAPVLLVRSQFDRHQLNADLRVSYVDAPRLPQINRPTVDGKVNGRYDLTDTMALNGEGHFALDGDDPGTARFTNRFQKIPLVTTTGGSAGVAKKLDNVEVSLKGTTDVVRFQDVTLTDGQRLTNQDRNFNQYGAQGRVTYALTPEISPFVDVAIDRRIHNQQVDIEGFRRDSTGTAVETGVTFAIADKLTGDVAIGYLVRQYQDMMLRPVSGFIADANLVWQFSKETTVQLGAKSQVAEIAEAGISGVLRRDGTLQIDHQFQPWLIGTLTAGYGQDQFVGSTRVDDRYFVDIGMLYKVSRLLQLKANLRQESTRSNVQENNLNATVVQVGARIQY
jgi:hypothetical protein